MLQIPELLAPAGDAGTSALCHQLWCRCRLLWPAGVWYALCPGQLHPGAADGKEVSIYAHARGRKVYLTMNTLPTNEEADRLPEAIKEAARRPVWIPFYQSQMPCVCWMPAEPLPRTLTCIFLPRPASPTGQAARAAYKMGAKRVVLAREMTLQGYCHPAR